MNKLESKVIKKIIFFWTSDKKVKSSIFTTLNYNCYRLLPLKIKWNDQLNNFSIINWIRSYEQIKCNSITTTCELSKIELLNFKLIIIIILYCYISKKNVDMPLRHCIKKPKEIIFI
jgi:hypothetical protein